MNEHEMAIIGYLDAKIDFTKNILNKMLDFKSIVKESIKDKDKCIYEEAKDLCFVILNFQEQLAFLLLDVEDFAKHKYIEKQNYTSPISMAVKTRWTQLIEMPTRWKSVKDEPPTVAGEYFVIAAGQSWPLVAEFDTVNFRDNYLRKLKVLFWSNVPKLPTTEEIYNEMRRVD